MWDAKKKLNIKSTKVGFGGKWHWELVLPPAPQEEPGSPF